MKNFSKFLMVLMLGFMAMAYSPGTAAAPQNDVMFSWQTMDITMEHAPVQLHVPYTYVAPAWTVSPDVSYSQLSFEQTNIIDVGTLPYAYRVQAKWFRITKNYTSNIPQNTTSSKLNFGYQYFNWAERFGTIHSIYNC